MPSKTSNINLGLLSKKYSTSIHRGNTTRNPIRRLGVEYTKYSGNTTIRINKTARENLELVYPTDHRRI